MSMQPRAQPIEAQPKEKQGGTMGFIKRNPWVVMVGIFAVLIVVGIVVS